MRHRKKWKWLGFTLIELLVVITIIGILAVIIGFVTAGLRDRVRTTIVAAQLKEMKRGIQLLVFDTNNLPGGCDPVGIFDIEFPMTDPSLGLASPPPLGSNGACSWTTDEVALWSGPYMTRSVDPWGKPYWYDPDYWPRRDCPSDDPYPGNPVYPALVSMGPNGKGGPPPDYDYDCDDIFLLLQDGEFLDLK